MSVLWFFVGGFVGIVVASLAAAAGQADRCEECHWRKEAERDE